MTPSQHKYEVPPWSNLTRDATLQTGDWRYQRPVLDQEKCRLCGECFLYCPTGSVLHKEDHFEIDLGYCKGCGICAQVCPVNAVTLTREWR